MSNKISISKPQLLPPDVWLKMVHGQDECQRVADKINAPHWFWIEKLKVGFVPTNDKIEVEYH